MMLPMVSSVVGRLPINQRDRSRSPPPQSSDDTDADTTDSPFYPSIFDVLKVRYLLQHKIRKELPLELVDLIIDAAEYWPSVETRRDEKTIIRQDQDRVVLMTAPLCYDEANLDTPSPRILPHRTLHPCRKIVFSIASHDQGWGGDRAHKGTYTGSFTWFDTEVFHAAHQGLQPEPDNEEAPEPEARVHFGPDHPLLLPSARRLQANKTGTGQTQEHVITWHVEDQIRADSAEAEEIERTQGRGRATLDGRVVREMRVGDGLRVWGRARFGGWANHVEGVSVRVFWAV